MPNAHPRFLELVLASACAITALAGSASAQDAAASKPSAAPEVRFLVKDWLVLPATDKSGRRPFNASAPFARYLLAPGSATPTAGEELVGDLGEKKAWAAAKTDEHGRVDGDFAWAFATVESATECVRMADLQGAGRLYVNGAGFAGDLYGYGFRGVPVALRAGKNAVFVGGVRGGVRLELWSPSERVVVGGWDVTKPMLVAGVQPSPLFAGVPVMNATRETIAVTLGAGGATAGAKPRFELRSALGPTLPPLCLDKPLLEIAWIADAPKEPGKVVYPLLVDGREHPFELEVVASSAARRITFPSRVDASAQECSVLPALQPTRNVVLSLHGASVDALNQARSYSPKKDFTVVAPTNRRPFGFDWQDWGRANAYEALAAAIRPLKEGDVDVFLTGHSMGGHGTWHLAANDPTRFVAIAPSAGWSSFDSYGGGTRDGELAALWRGADGGSDTLGLIANLIALPTFILHGEADDNVPVSEARKMESALKEHGGTPVVHVQPGAGHWWDGDAAAGADCVDWPAIFDSFRAAKPRAIGTALDAVSADPSVQSVLGWCELLQPVEYGRPMRVRSSGNPSQRELVVGTENVRAFRFHASPKGWSGLELVIDGERIALKSWDVAGAFVRTSKGWQASSSDYDPARQKSPELSGPFKRAFDRGFVLVYGTAGDEREDEELLARARCDAESWWYRGNGSARVVSDAEFVKHGLGTWIFGMELEDFVPNVILYGNADTNAAWTKLLPGAPIDARRGSMRLGTKEWKGDDLAALFVQPRRDEQGRTIALVGAFADSGVRGARLGYVLAPFASGVGYPDYTVFDSSVLAKADGGVLAAGFFDHAWRLTDQGFVRAAPVEQR
ncbi:MAG: prolyl oligopeptidase family serine peptidase [Planctomycetes bacterium]|nr:prolyl oligopeptidase family serine peptidase [Planctomycetota bacterium]